MKRWKLIRSMLASVGYTTIDSAEGVTIQSIDDNGYITYTDADGNIVKAKYNSTTPIAVDTEVSTINIALTSVYLAGVSGYTALATLTSEDTDPNGDAYDISHEITRTASSDPTKFITGGTYGTTLSAVAEGSSNYEVYHPDVSATTAITVGQINSEINVSGGTLATLDRYTVQLTAGTAYDLEAGITLYNQDGVAITNGSNATIVYKVGEGSATAYATDYTPVINDNGENLVIYDSNAYDFNSAWSGATITLTVVETE